MYAPVSIKRNERDSKVFSADCVWGYFSNKDGERHSFDLCESCYDELLKTFLIPVEIEKQADRE